MIAAVPKPKHKRPRPQRQFTKQPQTLSVQLLKDTHARIAERAITYRVPMEVTHVLKFPNGLVFSRCPRCQITLDREYVNYCDRCGQKLAWSRLKHVVVCTHGEKPD